MLMKVVGFLGQRAPACRLCLHSVGQAGLVDLVRRLSSSLTRREVRGAKQNYLYSKIMIWVAIDRGLRLADKRCLPCPNRTKWITIRDQVYEEVQMKGWK